MKELSLYPGRGCIAPNLYPGVGDAAKLCLEHLDIEMHPM
jgi:heterodisulfide reductase subunit B